MGRRWRSAAVTPLLVTGLVAGWATGTAAPAGASTGAPATAPVLGRSASSVAPATPLAHLAAVPAVPAVTANLRPGSRGAQVLALQRRLNALGYWTGTPNGSYGDLTRQAVIALQKAAGLTRDGVLGSRTRAALNAGVRPAARTTRGHVIEIDLRRQVLMIVDNGRVRRILNTSTGSGVWYTAPDGSRAHATTPVGTFRVQWQINGWHTSSLGQLYRPKYFHLRGIAVHGATSVPAYPASHGCVRVSLPAMDMLWSSGLIPVGTQVTVY